MVAMRDAVGEFPAVPAPEDSWRRRDDWPPVGKLVELCWVRRKLPSDDPIYSFGRGALAEREGCSGSRWVNPRNETMIFNPDFWREISDVAIEDREAK